jgi:SAM-dependent methyltransferase
MTTERGDRVPPYDSLERSAERFLTTGWLPREECLTVAAVPVARLYTDPVFADFSVAQQVSPDTDDGSRRLGLCRQEVRLLGPHPAGRVLDLMCGVGTYVAAFRAEGRSCVTYLGVDISEVAVHAAQRDHRAPGTQFRPGDVVAGGFDPHAWDTVLLMYEAMNSLGPADTGTVLRHVAAALAAGGRALVDLQLCDGRDAEPAAGRSATVLGPGEAAPVAGAGLVAIRTVPVRSTASERLVEYHVHWLDGTGCVYHIGYPWWEPSRSRIQEIFAEAGLRAGPARQVHRRAVTDKPSIRSSWQFVLEAAA